AVDFARGLFDRAPAFGARAALGAGDARPEWVVSEEERDDREDERRETWSDPAARPLRKGARHDVYLAREHLRSGERLRRHDRPATIRRYTRRGGLREEKSRVGLGQRRKASVRRGAVRQARGDIGEWLRSHLPKGRQQGEGSTPSNQVVGLAHRARDRKSTRLN